MKFTITLPADQQPLTVRHLLEEEWLVPRKVRHFLRVRKNVFVNQQPALFHQTVTAGDDVTLIMTDNDYQHQPILTANKKMIQVLYEDEHLIIVDKPAGIKTHPNQPQESDTLLNHLAAYLNKAGVVPYVVHRLDKETSGAIVFAKNPFVLPILGRLLEQKKITRRYQAIVSGRLNENLSVRKKIGRDRHDRRKRIIDKKGQSAVTHIQVIQADQSTSKIICQLDTGRTHQIRVHLDSIGHPIIGDPLYNPVFSDQRLQLHAFELSLIHPFTKKTINVQALPGLF